MPPLLMSQITDLIAIAVSVLIAACSFVVPRESLESTVMNHSERRKQKRKRWRERKKTRAAEERKKDRERGIEKRAEILLAKRRVETTKDRNPLNQSKSKEINVDHIVRTGKHLGSGTFGSCFLAFYRSLTVVVKELKYYTKGKGDDEAKRHLRKELLHEADVVASLGDHPGVPLLFGVCSKQIPYKLVLQFHGEGSTSFTIASALRARVISKRSDWFSILVKILEALEHIHTSGFLHNDLKSNNVLLEKRGNSYFPVVIDFGKSRRIVDAGERKEIACPKKQEDYKRTYPHIAPEIVEGRDGQSTRSDVYSFGVMAKSVFVRGKYGEFPEVISRCLSNNPAERPRCQDIIENIKK